MANGWIFQKIQDVRKLGVEQAPYYAGWYEPDSWWRLVIPGQELADACKLFSKRTRSLPDYLAGPKKVRENGHVE